MAPRAPRSADRAHWRGVEALEGRLLLSVAKDSDGFTVVTPPAGARVVYVSAAGNDFSNDGLSVARPVQTISKGRSLLRNGTGDQLLLRRGDVFSGQITSWGLSGASASDPMVIGAYTDPSAPSPQRPRIASGNATGFATTSTSSSHPLVNHLVIQGIAFEADSRNFRQPPPGRFTTQFRTDGNGGTYGINVVGPLNDLLVEDCSFQYYRVNLSFQGVYGAVSNVNIRRSIITDAYAPDVDGGGSAAALIATSAGIYTNWVDGLTLEENVFDHNGWTDGNKLDAIASIYNHNAYINSYTRNFKAIGNLIANAASYGLQARGGGIVKDNLFLRNPIGMLYGYVNGEVTPGGVYGEISGNVTLEGNSIYGDQRGWGLSIGNLKPRSADGTGGTIVRDNIYSTDTQGAFPAIQLTYGTNTVNRDQEVGINDLTIENNIVYGWSQSLNIKSGFNGGGFGYNGYNGVVVRNNDFQANFKSPIIDHANTFRSTAETWSGNRYSSTKTDSGSTAWFKNGSSLLTLPQWAALEQKPIAAAVNYPAPSRNVYNYQATVGGAPTMEAYVAEARQQGRTYWRPQYLARPAVDYIRAGFAGQKVDVSAPTASVASAPNLTSGGGELYTFSIAWSDDNQISAASLGNGDVRVAGANYSAAATLVSVSSNAVGSIRTATYTIPAPAGRGWSASDNGSYSIIVQLNEVLDTAGKAAPAGVIGAAAINIPAAAPVARFAASDVAGPTAAAAINVTYSTDGAISTTARPVRVDEAASGSWQGVFGARGAALAASGASLAAGTSLSLSGAGVTVWADSTTDPRALQRIGGTDRIASAWSAPNSFNLDLTLPAGQARRIALYCLDWDNAGRTQTIEALDPNSGLVLASQTIAAFTGGKYAVFDVSSSVRFRITAGGGGGAVISGIFVDTPPAMAALAPIDGLTLGSWKEGYGSQGAVLFGDSFSFPSYATLSIDNALLYTWETSTTDPRALERSASSERQASTLYGPAFTATVGVGDGQTHRVSFYCLDWDSPGRSQVIQAFDPTTGQLLAGQYVDDFRGGKYVSFDVAGTVQFRFINTGPINAVLAGVFLDPSPIKGTPISTATIDSNDLWITGPKGYAAPAALASIDAAGDGTPRTAVYTAAPPAEGWTPGGSYVVSARARQVTTTAGVSLPAGALGAFTARFVGPSASATAPTVTAPGGEIAVNVTYTDDLGVNLATLDSSDLRLIGPSGSGFSAPLALDPSSVTSVENIVTARYTLPAPAGGWTAAANGVYTVVVQPGQVADADGAFAPAGAIGVVTLAIDGYGPLAAARTYNITAAGSSPKTVTVSYDDPSGIDLSTIGYGDLYVTGPNGFSVVAAAVSVPGAGTAASATAIFSFNPPGGAWTTAANGTYSMYLQSGQVRDVLNNYNSQQTIGTFTVNVDTLPPVVQSVGVANLTAPLPAYTFSVTYSDNFGVNVASIDSSDILVFGPSGQGLAVTLKSISSTTNGTPRTATYSLAAPAGTWRSADNGSYSIVLQYGAISDINGLVISGGTIGAFQVNLETTPPTAQIGVVSPDPRYDPLDAMTVQFDEPVKGVDLPDLVLSRDGGPNLLTDAQTIATADGAGYTLGNLGALTTAVGSYTLTLNATGSGITDLAGNALSAGASRSFTVYDPPPTVAAFTINDGAPQRSRISQLSVTFNRPVVADGGAFQLLGRNGAGANTYTLWSNPSGDRLTWIGAIGGSGASGGSLPDGIYDLRIFAGQIHGGSPTGATMSADAAFAFHRLFSDADGDGDSDNLDLFQMRSAYNSNLTDRPDAYKSYFDYDGDGDVDNADIFQVRARRSIEYKGYDG